MKLEETKRTSRILEIVQIIAIAPRRYLRRDLAERFEVSERMIQKDLEVIRHGLRLPLEHTRDGYYFEQMPRLPALQYTFAEALALLLAVQAARQISGVGSTELAAAIARLEALFPAEFMPWLQQIVSPPVTTVRREHRQQMLRLLNRALLERRRVRIIYETRWRGERARRAAVSHYALRALLAVDRLHGNSKQIDRKNRPGCSRAALTKFKANEAGVDVRVKSFSTQPHASQTPWNRFVCPYTVKHIRIYTEVLKS